MEVVKYIFFQKLEINKTKYLMEIYLIHFRFKVYHYSGSLVHETIWPQGQELLGIEWQKFPENQFAEPIITKVKPEGIKSSLPEASKKAYTPPHLRMIKEGKDPDKFLPRSQINSNAQPGNIYFEAYKHICI